MVIWCYILASCLGAVVVLYSLLEIHYFLRMCLCVILARFVKSKSHILDTTTVTGVCLTTDVDTLLYHMNNARYLREIDFARVDFYERTRLYRTIVEKGGAAVQGASTIRYRRFIRPFSLFRITSKIIYWDEQSIFMEHKFISPKDNFVHCIAVCRQRILHCKTEEVMSALLATSNANQNSNSESTIHHNQNVDVERGENGEVPASPSNKLRPEMPLDIAKWMEYNEISSKNLRGGC